MRIFGIMKIDRPFILIAALAALLAGLPMRRPDCPACGLSPQGPAKDSVLTSNNPTPKP